MVEVARRLIITRQYPPLTHFQSSSTLTAAARLPTPASASTASATVSVPISATASRLQSLAPAPALISALLSNPVFGPVCGAGFVSVSIPGSLFGLLVVCSIALISMLVSVPVYRAISSADFSTVYL